MEPEIMKNNNLYHPLLLPTEKKANERNLINVRQTFSGIYPIGFNNGAKAIYHSDVVRLHT